MLAQEGLAGRGVQGKEQCQTLIASSVAQFLAVACLVQEAFDSMKDQILLWHSVVAFTWA